MQLCPLVTSCLREQASPHLARTSLWVEVDLSGQFFPLNCLGQYFLWFAQKRGCSDSIILYYADVLILTKSIYVRKNVPKIEQLLQAYWKQSLEYYRKRIHRKDFWKPRERFYLMSCDGLSWAARPCTSLYNFGFQMFSVEVPTCLATISTTEFLKLNSMRHDRGNDIDLKIYLNLICFRKHIKRLAYLFSLLCKFKSMCDWW